MNRQREGVELSLLDVALDCVRRGWYVFPCKPCDKEPLGGLVPHGWKDASNDEATVRLWWSIKPEANVAIATGPSGLTVLDCDHGLAGYEDFQQWRESASLPQTYTVRTGRRDSYGVQLYYSGPQRDSIAWKDDGGCSGDIRSETGYVMAAGSIHPDTGEVYEVMNNEPIVPAPPYICALKQATREREALTDPNAPITEWRNDTLIRILGKHRAAGADDAAIEFLAHHINETRMAGNPLDEEELGRIIHNAQRWPIGEIPPELVLGGGKTAEQATEPQERVDWRTRYHTFDEMANAPEPTFIIEGFIQRDVITAIAAPVGQRKTIIAANVVHSSITGEPLFGHFKVVNRPARVLYLCPEMGLFAFSKRIRDLGLMPYVGKTLFCRTMNSEGRLSLRDLTGEELAGALVVVDTAVRFVEGDENSSEDMKVFAEDCFRLMKAGAASVIVLFHSPKGTKEASDLTLENAMRGSGDLGAFVSSCWATRLQDPSKPWESESYLKNVKQRDFESDPCTVKSDKLGRLHIVVKPGDPVTLNTKSTGPRGNADGKEEAALQVIRDNPKLTQKAIVDKLKEMGVKRGKTWVGEKRYELLQAAGGVMP